MDRAPHRPAPTDSGRGAGTDEPGLRADGGAGLPWCDLRPGGWVSLLLAGRWHGGGLCGRLSGRDGSAAGGGEDPGGGRSGGGRGHAAPAGGFRRADTQPPRPPDREPSAAGGAPRREDHAVGRGPARPVDRRGRAGDVAVYGADADLRARRDGGGDGRGRRGRDRTQRTAARACGAPGRGSDGDGLPLSGNAAACPRDGEGHRGFTAAHTGSGERHAAAHGDGDPAASFEYALRCRRRRVGDGARARRCTNRPQGRRQGDAGRRHGAAHAASLV